MTRAQLFLELHSDLYPVENGKMDVKTAIRFATDFAKQKKVKPKQPELIQHPLTKYISDKYPNITAALELPKHEQAEELIKTCGKVWIDQKLKALENMPDLKKKYRTVYLTLLNWHSMGNNQSPSPSGERKELPIRP